jgi:cytochrome c-type biogenesis protein CcmH/NrfG
VLWVGGREPAEAEVQAALRTEGVRVEEAALDGLVERANRRAPDLIVLAGLAAGAPDAILGRLMASHPARFVPVITLGPSAAARPKARSRFGLVARLDGEEEPGAIGKRIATLLRGLSRRPARWRVKVALEELPSVIRRTADAGRCGLLAAAEGGAVAIDAGGTLAPDPALLVASLTGTLEPTFSLHERAPGRVRVLRAPPRDDETPPTLEGARVLAIDERADRAASIAARLEAAGAQTRSAVADAAAIQAARGFDPTLVVVAAPALVEPALAPLWTDARLSVAPLLVLEDEALRASPATLLSTVGDLCAPERALRARLVRGEAVAERLETLGPTRWLKVLGRCEHDVTFRLFAAAGRGRVDLSSGTIQGASFHPSDPRAAAIQGRAAVEAIVALRFGRVLAGPPGELGKLEGMRRRRKMSIVGRIVPAPSADGPRGLVTEEVVVQRMGGGAKVAVPKPGGVAVPPPRSLPDPPAADEAPSPADFAPLGDVDDAPTATYSAEHMSALRAQLRRTEKAGAEPGAEAGGEGPTGTAAGRAEGVSAGLAAGEGGSGAEGARSAANSEGEERVGSAVDAAPGANAPGERRGPSRGGSAGATALGEGAGSMDGAAGGKAAGEGGADPLDARSGGPSSDRGAASVGGAAGATASDAGAASVAARSGAPSSDRGAASVEDAAGPTASDAGAASVEDAAGAAGAGAGAGSLAGAAGSRASGEGGAGSMAGAAGATGAGAGAGSLAGAAGARASGEGGAGSRKSSGGAEPAAAAPSASAEAGRRAERGGSPEASSDDASDGPAVAAAEAPRRSSSAGTFWFAAALVLAVAVGGYAAWHLGDETPAELRAEAERAETAVAGAPPEEGGSSAEPAGAAEDPGAGEATGEAVIGEPVGDGAGEATTGDAVEATLEEDAPRAEDAAADGTAERSETAGEEVAGALSDGRSEPAEAVDGAPAAGEAAPADHPAEDADAAALIEQAHAAAQARNYPRSEELARQALSHAPRSPRAAYRLAVALYRQRQLDEAATWAERAAEWDPEDPLPVSLQGDIHMRQGRFHHAARAYQRALEVEPRFRPAQRQLDRLRERGVGQN